MAHSAGSRAKGVFNLSSLARFSAPLLEEAISKLKGVTSVRVNNASRKVTVDFDPSQTSFDQIRDAIRHSA